MKERKYKKVNIRTVNAFLRKKGIDPKDLAEVIQRVSGVKRPKLQRPQIAKIKDMLTVGKKALVYANKQGKVVVRDASKKFNFEKYNILRKAMKSRNGHAASEVKELVNA